MVLVLASSTSRCRLTIELPVLYLGCTLPGEFYIFRLQQKSPNPKRFTFYDYYPGKKKHPKRSESTAPGPGPCPTGAAWTCPAGGPGVSLGSKTPKIRSSKIPWTWFFFVRHQQRHGFWDFRGTQHGMWCNVMDALNICCEVSDLYIHLQKTSQIHSVLDIQTLGGWNRQNYHFW